MKNRYLLELGVEEFPAAYVKDTKKQLKEAFEKLFDQENVKAVIKVESTPRRFAVLINDIEQQGLGGVEKVKGPSVKISYDSNGNPNKPLLGFLRGQGKNIEDVFTEMVGDTEYVFVEKEIKIKPIKQVLVENVAGIITGLNFPKAMHWGGMNIKFARPLRWIVSILDDEVLDFELEKIPVGNKTRGHRILGSGEITIDKIDNYEALLKKNGVILKQEDRKNIILQGAYKLAREKGGNLYKDDSLLEEIVNIVEYPTPLIANIKKEFLLLPSVVIITPMKDHQRYFPIIDDDGKLLPYFITVRNGDEKGLEQVEKGNEKVLAPRLEDAKFFYDEDKKKPLYDYVDVLKTATFHEKLGTIYDKVRRLEKLAELVGKKLAVGEETIKNTQRAALLSKADLVTKLVIEFTELQGTMGEIYARESGENAIVSQAIGEQYLPRFSGDELPKSTAGKLLSIVDKIDTIVGMYAVGVRVTGSQDPFALRRSVLGILNILIENRMDLDLDSVVDDALFIYTNEQNLVFDYDTVKSEIMDFINQRLKVKLISEGARYDIIDSIFASGTENIYCTVKKVDEVEDWIKTNENQVMTLSRIENMVKDAKADTIDEDLLREEKEKALYNKFIIIKEVEDYINLKDYSQALRNLDNILDEVNDFMDNTMIMVEDESLRRNRISLIATINDAVKKLFIPSMIVRV